MRPHMIVEFNELIQDSVELAIANLTVIFVSIHPSPCEQINVTRGGTIPNTATGNPATSVDPAQT